MQQQTDGRYTSSKQCGTVQRPQAYFKDRLYFEDEEIWSHLHVVGLLSVQTDKDWD